jgi:hypothetical protein
MLARHPFTRLVLAAVLSLCVIIGAQALATAVAPKSVQLSQSRVIGQAGFAYLGGLRMMGAGMLYQRLDPQFHQYLGGDKHIENRIDLLPTIRIIQMLNPQLEQPYYYVSFILALRGRMGDALALAKQGVENNPTSGLLRASYAQLLMMQDKKANLPEMLRQCRIGLGSTATYTSQDDQFESYGVFRSVYELAGDRQMVAKLEAEQKRLGAEGASSGGSGGSGLGAMVNSWANSATSSE